MHIKKLTSSLLTEEASPGGGADGGVDLVLTRTGKNGGEKFLVQCKRWRAFKVGAEVVRELYALMAAGGAPAVSS